MTVSSEVTRRTGSGLTFLVVAGTLWGTGGLTGSLLARETGLSAPAVATYRLGVGGLLLVLFLLLNRRWPSEYRRRSSEDRHRSSEDRHRSSEDRGALPRGRAAWTRIVVLGLLAAAFQACYFAAVARVSVSLATLLTIGASPVLVVLAETIAARRRPDARSLTTVALAVTGLTLLVGVPSAGRGLAATLAGAGFALLAAAGFATMTLVGARPVAGLDDVAATGIGFTLGAAALAPLAAAGGGLGITPTPATLGLLFLLGTGPTAIAYAAYFRGLRTAPAGTAALMALLEPLVGTALSVLILGDRLEPAGMAGAVLLVTALVMAARRTLR